ncbi:MAG: class I SAM-dependent rRNA methyltransferase [Verrucomicrobiia bacterium]|jgi:23S rRNA (cytosine1962-C5)-methyltransferase
MEKVATVVLKNEDARRVIGGHPWIYSGSIHKTIGSPADGDVVNIVDSKERFLGLGFFNSKSKINVRVISREQTPINEEFFVRRITDALQVRKRFMPQATSFRVVNAEGDFLSGLIIDKYEDVLVLQTSSLGMDKRKEIIANALVKVFSPRAILEKNDIAARKFEGLPDSSGILYGSLNGDVNVNINGLTFPISLPGGHKTGLYLDQQINYLKVSRFAKDAEVLDCFSFFGGFALHAAKANAKHIHALEQSPEAVELGKKIAAANGLNDKISWETVNAFDWLKASAQKMIKEQLPPQYDLIILDPPSFTRNRSAIPDALRGYKEIHLRAFKLIKPGGILATFCCSHHVGYNLFYDVILEAASDAHVLLRRIEIYTQAPDHPVIASIPETEYLKGFAFEVIK